MSYSEIIDILEYTSGSVFRGFCCERKPSKGVYQYSKGDLYIGDFDIEGKFSGFGMYMFSNGSLYVGYFENGLYEGEGVEIRSNGDIVFGNYSRDHINGLCVIYSDGEYRWYRRNGDKLTSTDAPYEIPDDFGYELKSFRVADLSNGDTYIGFKDEEGKYSGWGLYRFNNGTLYIGEFSENDFNGNGCWLSSNGNIQVGEFSEDKFSDGIKFHSNDNYIKITDSICSECGIVFEDGSRYQGGYNTETGRYEGEGIYTWADGTVFNGWWKDGTQFGRGTYYYPSGNREEGVWLGTEQIVPGTETYKKLCRYSDGPSFWESLFSNLPKIIVGVAAAVLVAKIGGRATDIMRNCSKSFSPRVPGMSSATSSAISFAGNAASRQFKNGCKRSNLSPLQSHISRCISPVFKGYTEKVLKITGGGSQTIKVKIGKPKGTVTKVLFEGIWHDIASDNTVKINGKWWKL